MTRPSGKVIGLPRALENSLQQGAQCSAACHLPLNEILAFLGKEPMSEIPVKRFLHINGACHPYCFCEACVLSRLDTQVLPPALEIKNACRNCMYSDPQTSPQTAEVATPCADTPEVSGTALGGV